MTELEILRRARKTIAEMPYKFASWNVCTCGHLYAASTGTWGPAEGTYCKIVKETKRNRALRGALEACLGDDHSPPETLAVAVSTQTANEVHPVKGRSVDYAMRLAALNVLDQAIARLRDACGEKRAHVAVGDQSRRTSGPNASRARDELRVGT